MENKNKARWAWTAVIILIVAGAYLYRESGPKNVPADPAVGGEEQAPPAPFSPNLESYVSGRISDLSPVKEQLGGKFYVTRFEAKDGKGTVEYEDGHNAYTADFTYAITESGEITVNSFTIRD